MHSLIRHKHPHMYAIQRHILINTYISKQAYTHTLTQTHTLIKHTCIHIYMHLYSFLLTKDQEPSPLDARALECPKGTMETHRKSLSSFLAQIETPLLFLAQIETLPATSPWDSADTTEVEPAKIINTTNIFENLYADTPHLHLPSVPDAKQTHKSVRPSAQ